ncbi:acyl-CoA dehydrogenase family protein [Dactylosporangium sp. CA-092794]|uniref:acyl-CoA dehydrogenase family protein n=1 Tax=Dactylosporangium sp. CA-092794 TaxID=3239929 RepID=UPI003D8C901C
MTEPLHPDLLYSEVEDELRASVRALLRDRADLRRLEGPEPVDLKLWRTLAAELGCAGLPVPEASGGAGASWRETAVVMEELGRSVAPVPFLGSAVLATAALPAGDPLLAELAAGTRTAALAVPLSAAGGQRWTVAVRDGGLHGEVTSVADALAADVLLVPTAEGLFAIDTNWHNRNVGNIGHGAADISGQSAAPIQEGPAPIQGSPAPTEEDPARSQEGPARSQEDPAEIAAEAGGSTVEIAAEAGGGAVEIAAVTSFDLSRPLADIALRGAAGRLVAGDAGAAVARALTAGAAMLASEQLGIAEWCLATTVEYAKTRRQFARQIGSYQAIKHRLADLWVAVTEARAVARYAADCLATGDPDLPVAASLAQAFCSPVAVKAAEECVQLHGGIGFTWEHPAHWYLKRARADATALGSAARHRALLAELVHLPG